jgi:hypothetical protein
LRVGSFLVSKKQISFHRSELVSIHILVLVSIKTGFSHTEIPNRNLLYSLLHQPFSTANKVDASAIAVGGLMSLGRPRSGDKAIVKANGASITVTAVKRAREHEYRVQIVYPDIGVDIILGTSSDVYHKLAAFADYDSSLAAAVQELEKIQSEAHDGQTWVGAIAEFLQKLGNVYVGIAMTSSAETTQPTVNLLHSLLHQPFSAANISLDDFPS